MQPIAAPTTIPLVAIVASAEAASANPSAMTGDGQPVAAQASLIGEGSSVFALLLAPLAMPADGTAPTTTAVVAQLAAPAEDGLAALLAPAAPDAAPDAKSAEDSELLALLAAFSVAPAPAALPADVPMVAGDSTVDEGATTQIPASSADLACTALLTQLSAMSMSDSATPAPAPSAVVPAPQAAVPQPATPAAPVIPGQPILPDATPGQAQPVPAAVEEVSPATTLVQAIAGLGEAKPSRPTVPRAATPTPTPATPAAIPPSAQTTGEIAAVAQPVSTPELAGTIAQAVRRDDKPSAKPAPAPLPVAETAIPVADQPSAPPAAVATATPPVAAAVSQAEARPVTNAANVVATPQAAPAVSPATPATPAAPAPATKPVSEDAPVAELPLKTAAEPTTSATAASVNTLRPEPLAAAQRSEAATATPRAEPNPLDRAVAHQVSRAIIQHLPDGGTRMVMRLTPPELGTVRIEFLSRDGMMTARLMAEDEGVRQALDRALPQIRADVRSDQPSLSITVERGDQRQAWDEGHARQQQQRDDQRSGQGGRRGDDQPAFSIDGVEALAPSPLPQRADPVLGGRVTNATIDALA